MDFQREGQRLFLTDQDQLQAEITFPVVNDQTWLMEHIWVSDRPNKRLVARSLFDAVIELADAAHVDLLPLDPFARHIFATDPAVKKYQHH
ncbi:N-acetyltransferase [Furfurilactobacillus rossiae]|nr:N-acetyltransferase [Furfurilactobacillus rossiae]MCF6164530.1 hypothetical protein [Furfurilactobacillus rossiae]QFR66622.1 hypothetical protein LR814_05735 [Furfurilactobacillus rossiae]QLE62094.1 hypothetical protein LROSRS0_2049 [Furfurilactobacillus rossiae]QLE64813.1 hypothetical protein LROSL1_2012 [Furfurilactobacillus rossiae]